LLAANLPAGTIHTGHKAIGFEQNGDVARVQFAHGATVEADVVVAADGIHSELRRYVCPPSKPVFHGTMAYRGLVARERLPDWPMDRWQMWAGPARHFLVFPVRHATMVNYVGFVPTDEAMKESWSAPGDPAVLRREFDGWDPRIANVLQQVDTTFRWALYDREPLPAWTKGRLTLLGDAAHPMLPRGSNGAGQAILDARALTAALRENANPVAALAVYEQQRLEATTRIVLTNRTNPPDAILREVFQRTKDRPFKAIEDVISREELVGLTESYKQIAGYSKEALRR